MDVVRSAQGDAIGSAIAPYDSEIPGQTEVDPLHSRDTAIRPFRSGSGRSCATPHPTRCRRETQPVPTGPEPLVPHGAFELDDAWGWQGGEFGPMPALLSDPARAPLLSPFGVPCAAPPAAVSPHRRRRTRQGTTRGDSMLAYTCWETLFRNRRPRTCEEHRQHKESKRSSRRRNVSRVSPDESRSSTFQQDCD